MRVGHLFFFTCHAGIFVAIAGRKCLGCYLCHGTDDISRTVTVCGHSLYIDGREHIKACQRLRTIGLGQFYELANRRHSTVCLHKDIVQ